MNISIHTLPERSSFVSGLYGLESVSLQGLVVISRPRHTPWPFIESLTVTLEGLTTAEFSPLGSSSDTLTRRRTHCNLSLELLDQLDLRDAAKSERTLCIPFDLLLPDSIHEPGETPAQISARLMPPSFSFTARASLASSASLYSARTTFTLTAELVIPQPNPILSALSSPIITRTASTKVAPWVVFDPRQIQRNVMKDGKVWRSAPETEPLEYDVGLERVVMGPGDELRVHYRLAIARSAARCGVRLDGVRLLLREHHFVGDSRGTYVRGVRELLSHFQSESPLTSSSLELESVAPSTKAGILRSRISSAGGDGLYAENAIVLAIPQLGKFAPTVNKINDVRNNVFPTPSQVEVKHSVQITIKLSCPERDKLFFPDIRLDCGCILMSVSADQLASVIDEFPQLMPRLEYEKVTGGEAYIPKYESEDPLIRELLLKEEQARIDRARRLWVRIWRQKRTDLGLCLPVHEDEENDENADDGSSDDDDDDESDPDTVDLEYQFGPLIPPLPESPVPSYPSSIASRRGSLRLLSPDSDHDVTQSCAPADDVTDGSLMPSPVPDSSQLPPPSLDLLSADTESSTSVPHPLQMPPSQRPASASKQQLKLPLLFPFSSPFLRKGKTPVYSVLSADSDVENGLSDAGSGVGDEGVGSGDASGSFGVGGLRSPTTLSAARIVTSNAMFDDATRHLIAEDLSEAVNSPITKSRSAVFAMTAAANVAAFGAPIVSDVEAVSDAAVLESLRHAVDQIDGELARFPAEPILWPPVPDSVPESVTGSDSNHDADLLPAAFAADEVPGQSEQDMASVALFDPLGAANSAPVEILVRRS